MRVALVIGLIPALVCAVLCSGCPKPNPLLGKWEATVLGLQVTTLEFTKDGFIIADSAAGKLQGTYKTEGEGQVRIVWTGENGSLFKYTIEGDNLTISLFGAPLKYARMKAAAKAK